MSVHLANRGPGAADFVVRFANGAVLQSGTLESVNLSFTPPTPVTLVIALEAHAGVTTTIEYSATGSGGRELRWTLADPSAR